MTRLVLFALLFWAAVDQTAQAQRTIFVSQSAVGANDGTSWADAFAFLQDGLAAAAKDDEVWVARGVYKPDQGAGLSIGDRSQSFVVLPGVRLYGGFGGTEESIDARLGDSSLTVLSGDLLGNDSGEIRPENPTRVDNSFHVIRSGPGGGEVLIDGLTIADGNAISEADHNYGGGVLATSDGDLVMTAVVIRNCSSRGFGGGLYIEGGSLVAERLLVSGNYSHGRGAGVSSFGAAIRLKKSAFRRNYSDDWGGGMYHHGVSAGETAGFSDVDFVSNSASLGGGLFHRVAPLTLVNAKFVGNTSSSEGGGLVLNDVVEAEVANALLAGNHAEMGGGGILLSENGDVKLTGLTMTSNTATSGPASLWSFHTRSTIVNTIAWSPPGQEAMRLEGDDRPRLGSSIVRGGLPAFAEDLGGVMDQDPLFLDPLGQDGVPGTEDDNLGLTSGSPAVDAGDNAFLPQDSFDLDEDGNPFEPLSVDLAGAHRIYDFSGSMVGGRVDIGALEYGSHAVSLFLGRSPIGTQPPSLGAYPNPVSKTLFVERRSAGPQPFRVEVVDVLGRVVAIVESDSATLSHFQIDTTRFRPGLYLLRTREGHRAVTTAFTVINESP